MPVAAQTPFLGSTLGQAVQRIAPSSSGIVTWDRTLLYVVLPFFGSSTIIFLTSKCPSSVRAIIVERSLDAALPTRTVVQDMRFSSLFRWLSSCIIAHFQNRDNFFSEALSSAGKSVILIIRTIYGRSHMDENRTNSSEYEAAPEQVVFFSPEFLQAAQQKQDRLGAIRAAAESGDAAALFELGVYSLGELGGQPRDAEEAFRCLSRLPHDNAAGLFYLSYCYDMGVGTERDQSKAAALLSESSELGYAPAISALGLCFENGRGVERDEKTAAELYARAAEQDYPPAICNLAVCYRAGIGVEQDLIRAASLFSRAAELHFPRAQQLLGVCYEFGEGVPLDLKKAFLLYEEAARQDYPEGICSLGVMYFNGRGCEEDREKAFSLFRRAADMGLVRAQFITARCYDNGDGVAPDPAGAFRYYTLAADGGHSDAMFLAGLCCAAGQGTERDHARAAAFWRSAERRRETCVRWRISASAMRPGAAWRRIWKRPSPSTARPRRRAARRGSAISARSTAKAWAWSRTTKRP